MRNISRIIVIQIFFLVILNSSLYSEDFKVERDWLLQPASARASAMGRADVAHANDASIVFSNPGGIVFLNNFSLSGSYYPAPYTSNKAISLFSLYFKSKTNNKVSFNHQRYNETDAKKYYGYGITMSKKISSIGIGINIKMFQFHDLPLDNIVKTNINQANNKKAYTFDLGALYYKDFRYKDLPVIENLAAGISLSNIFGRIKVSNNVKIKLPSFLRAGYSFSVKSSKHKKGLSLISFAHSFEYAKTINTSYYSSTGAGIELALYEIIYGRIGYYRRNSIIKGSTSGIGLSLPFNRFFKKFPLILKYDYGRFPYEYSPSEYLNAHSMTVSYRLHE